MGILRILLALAVIVAHCGLIWKFQPVGGPIAVETFFILSGFYMSLILNEKYKTASYRLFITNRFLRLYPLYWSVLIATGLFCITVFLISGRQSFPIVDQYLLVRRHNASFLFLASTNALIFGQDVVMFTGINPETGHLFFTPNFWLTSPPLFTFLFIPQAWSLGIELVFYLIAPLLLRKKAKWIILLIVLSLALRMYLYNVLGLQNDPWTYRFFPTEIVFFLLGNIAYRIYIRIKECPVPGYINILILSYVVLATTMYGCIPTYRTPFLPFSWNELVYFPSITAVIPFLFSHLKNWKVDSGIGELSYPVYLSHLLIAKVAYAMPYPVLQQSWCIALVTLVFSYLLHRGVAKPIEKYRQGRLTKASTISPGPNAVSGKAHRLHITN